MSSYVRFVRSPVRCGLAAVLAVGASALTACGASDTEPALATGVPTAYATGITEGHERYPDVGTTGMGAFDWNCPLESSIEVDGSEHDNVLTTAFAQPMEGVFLVQCDFYKPLSASLIYVEAVDDEAYGRLVEGTGAYEQQGNVQTQTTVTVGERDIIVVRWEYPTNKAAGTRYVAHYLDESTRSRVSLDVADSDARSDGYDEAAAAHDLAGILTGGA
ncbi:hypothetical protein [Cellulomonas soli]